MKRWYELIGQRVGDVLVNHGLSGEIAGVITGDPVAVVVRMIPGDLPSEYSAVAAALAHHLGVARIRVTPRGTSWVRIDLLERDPLATELPLQPSLGLPAVLLGVDDRDHRYRADPIDLGHLACQGQTGSGKSTFAYALLSQLVGRQDVLVAMSDPTTLLARPFRGSIHQPWHAAGTDVAAHLALLQRLVDEMDERIASIPARSDTTEVTEGTPLIVTVLEELPQLLALADDGKRGGPADQIRRHVTRLVSESRKAGMRTVVMAQRFEANTISGYARAQFGIRLSFRVDNGDSVELLHPGGRARAQQHAVSPPGVALLTAPGVPLVRIRTPYGATSEDSAYAAYWDRIQRVAPDLPDIGE